MSEWNRAWAQLRWSRDGSRLTLLACEGTARTLKGYAASGEVVWERTSEQGDGLTSDGSELVVLHPQVGFTVQSARTGERKRDFSVNIPQLFGPVVSSPESDTFTCESIVEGPFRKTLWSATSGRQVLWVQSAEAPWWSSSERCRFSSDGSLLLEFFDEENALVRRLDLVSCQEIEPWMGHLEGVLDAACSEGGRGVSLDRSDQIIVWEPDGTHRRLVSGVSGQCLALSACGRLLAVGGERGATALFDATSGERLAVSQAHDAPVRELCFSPDQGLLASVAADTSVRLHTPGDRVQRRSRRAWPLERINPSTEPSTELLALRGALLEQELLHGVGPAHREASLAVLAAHGGKLQHTGMAQSEYTWAQRSPDGRYLALGTEVPVERWSEEEGVIEVWEMASGRCVHRIEGVGNGVRHERGRIETDLMRWSPDSTRLAVQLHMNQVGVWDAFSGKGSPAIYLFPRNIDLSLCFDWSPDGRALVVNVGAGPESLGIFDLTAGSIQSPEDGAWLDVPGMPEDYGYKSLRWSADGERLLGFGAYVAEVRCSKTGLLVFQRKDRTTVASPDGRYLLLQQEGELVQTSDGSLLPVPWTKRALAVAWKDDGLLLALLYDDHLEVRAIPSGERLCRIPVQPMVPASEGYHSFAERSAFAFSPDGSRCAFFVPTGAVEIWSLGPMPEPLVTVAVHDSSEGLCFEREGQTLVTWGRDGVAFFSVPTGRCFNHASHLLPPGLDASGVRGHPLVAPQCAYGNAFEPDPSFPCPARGRWAWITLFPSGLLICPEQAVASFRARASLVVGERFGWPLHWLLGTEVLELHTGWETALASERLPALLPLEVRRWLAAPVAASAMAGFVQAESQHQGTEVSALLLPTVTAGGYELERIFHGETLTEENLRPYLGKVFRWSRRWNHVGALVRCTAGSLQFIFGEPESQGFLGEDLRRLAWAGPVRYLPDGRDQPLVPRTVFSLRGKRVWVRDPGLRERLLAQGAQIDEEMTPQTDLVVLGEGHLELPQVEALSLRCVPEWSLQWMIDVQ